MTSILAESPSVEVRISDKQTVRVSRSAARLCNAIAANLTADFSRGKRRDQCDLRLHEFKQSPLDAFALTAGSARLFCALLEGLALLRACNKAHANLLAAFRENAEIAATLKLAYQRQQSNAEHWLRSDCKARVHSFASKHGGLHAPNLPQQPPPNAHSAPSLNSSLSLSLQSGPGPPSAQQFRPPSPSAAVPAATATDAYRAQLEAATQAAIDAHKRAATADLQTLLNALKASYLQQHSELEQEIQSCDEALAYHFFLQAPGASSGHLQPRQWLALLVLARLLEAPKVAQAVLEHIGWHWSAFAALSEWNCTWLGAVWFRQAAALHAEHSILPKLPTLEQPQQRDAIAVDSQQQQQQPMLLDIDRLPESFRAPLLACKLQLANFSPFVPRAAPVAAVAVVAAAAPSTVHEQKHHRRTSSGSKSVSFASPLVEEPKSSPSAAATASAASTAAISAHAQPSAIDSKRPPLLVVPDSPAAAAAGAAATSSSSPPVNSPSTRIVALPSPTSAAADAAIAAASAALSRSVGAASASTESTPVSSAQQAVAASAPVAHASNSASAATKAVTLLSPGVEEGYAKAAVVGGVLAAHAIDDDKQPSQVVDRAVPSTAPVIAAAPALSVSTAASPATAASTATATAAATAPAFSSPRGRRNSDIRVQPASHILAVKPDFLSRAVTKSLSEQLQVSPQKPSQPATATPSLLSPTKPASKDNAAQEQAPPPPPTDDQSTEDDDVDSRSSPPHAHARKLLASDLATAHSQPTKTAAVRRVDSDGEDIPLPPESPPPATSSAAAGGAENNGGGGNNSTSSSGGAGSGASRRVKYKDPQAVRSRRHARRISREMLMKLPPRWPHGLSAAAAGAATSSSSRSATSVSPSPTTTAASEADMWPDSADEAAALEAAKRIKAALFKPTQLRKHEELLNRLRTPKRDGELSSRSPSPSSRKLAVGAAATADVANESKALAAATQTESKDEAQLLKDKEKRAKLRQRLLADDDNKPAAKEEASPTKSSDAQLLKSLQLPARDADAGDELDTTMPPTPAAAAAAGEANSKSPTLLLSPVAERPAAVVLGLNARRVVLSYPLLRPCILSSPSPDLPSPTAARKLSLRLRTETPSPATVPVPVPGSSSPALLSLNSSSQGSAGAAAALAAAGSPTLDRARLASILAYLERGFDAVSVMSPLGAGSNAGSSSPSPAQSTRSLSGASPSASPAFGASATPRLGIPTSSITSLTSPVPSQRLRKFANGHAAFAPSSRAVSAAAGAAASNGLNAPGHDERPLLLDSPPQATNHDRMLVPRFPLKIAVAATSSPDSDVRMLPAGGNNAAASAAQAGLVSAASSAPASFATSASAVANANASPTLKAAADARAVSPLVSPLVVPSPPETPLSGSTPVIIPRMDGGAVAVARRIEDLKSPVSKLGASRSLAARNNSSNNSNHGTSNGKSSANSNSSSGSHARKPIAAAAANGSAAAPRVSLNGASPRTKPRPVIRRRLPFTAQPSSRVPSAAAATAVSAAAAVSASPVAANATNGASGSKSLSAPLLHADLFAAASSTAPAFSSDDFVGAAVASDQAESRSGDAEPRKLVSSLPALLETPAFDAADFGESAPSASFDFGLD